MKFMKLIYFCTIMLGCGAALDANNQTPDVSTIHQGDKLPFKVQIEQADFSLPNGIHSGVFAVYKGKWLFLAGRTNGLHGFTDTPDNFPPSQQNRTIYVVDPNSGTVHSRLLTDPESGLDQQQIDTLSVTSPQFYQTKSTLYITGGYGYDNINATYGTKDTLTAINIRGLMHWVLNPSAGETAARHIRQISDPLFQATGGVMVQVGKLPTLLIFGQNFAGYYLDNSDGDYLQQVRRFRIIDDGVHLSFKDKGSKPAGQDPNYRRRDLSIVPCIKSVWDLPIPYYVALSGVFTLTGGAWTVPVLITANGRPSMASPLDPNTFKQGMNNYICPSVGLFSKHRNDMYTVLFGGISYEYFHNGVFQTDSELPFINQVTTIRIDKHGKFTQYLMDSEYPVILSTQSNPGNQLLFGAGAFFIEAEGLPMHNNGVIKMDELGKSPILLGYIVGGIQSTKHNTDTTSDSAASPYIFKVTLEK